MVSQSIWLVVSWRLWTFIVAAAVSLAALGSKAAPIPMDFPKQHLKIGKTQIEIEVADTPERTSRGLMYRQQMSEKAGMLFIFPDEQPRSFWMKNTFIPLSIGFFDAKKTLVDIQDMEPVKSEMDQSPRSYTSNGLAMYALEVNVGWFQRNKIKIGDRFELVGKTGPKK